MMKRIQTRRGAAVTRRRARRWLVAATVTLSVVLTACGSGDSEDDKDEPAAGGSPTTSAPSTGGSSSGGGPAAGGTLKVGLSLNPSSLDPITGTSGYDHPILYALFDTLIDFDPQSLEPKPGLAESWDQPDPQTLILTLREGVTFQDGTPFDAAAVKVNLDRALTDDVSLIKADLASIDSVEATDAKTVTIKLKTPDSSLPLKLADRPGMMNSPKAIEGGQDLDRNPVGTGPYKLDSWSGDEVVVSKNADYWNADSVYLDTISWRVFADKDTMVNAFLAGDVDFVFNVDAKDKERVEAADNTEVVVNTTLLEQNLYLDKTKPGLDDARVRRAIGMAINREQLVQVLDFGLGEPAWGPVPEASWAFPSDATPAFDYDPEGAKALLAEAGYGNGFKMSVWVPTGAPDARRAEVLKEQLSQVGIDLEIRQVESTKGIQEFWTDQKHDSNAWTWSGRPDPSQTWQLLTSEPSFFTLGATPQEIEDLLLKSIAETDQAARRAVFSELTRKAISEEALWIPLYFPGSVTAMRDNVEGFEPNLLGKPKVSGMWISQG